MTNQCTPTTDAVVHRLKVLTDILVETGDHNWANTTRAAAKRIERYDQGRATAKKCGDRRMGIDGYTWLLENCGDPEKAEHAAHLDDSYRDPHCIHCKESHYA